MKLFTLRFGSVLGSALFFLLAGKYSTSKASAQIVPDATLPVNSSVTQQGNTSLIEGGTRTGNNLFHSFGEFSVPTGGTAYFNNALDIQNIFSRVTGNSISNIDGVLRANGTANLFLLNPNGIIFGANARLNIGGSFLASTAQSVIFADGSFFHTKPSADTAPLLSVSVPVGLQFNHQPNTGLISVLGSGIRPPSTEELDTPEEVIDYQQKILNTDLALGVQPGKTLALLGGEVRSEGGLIRASQGQIFIGAIDNGEIRTPQNQSILDSFSIANPSSIMGNVEFFQNSGLSTSGSGGGNIQIIGDKVELRDSSIIVADTLEKQKAGTLSIQASQLIIKDGSAVSTSSYSFGSGGIISVRATEKIEVAGINAEGNNSILRAATFADGNAGNLIIDTGSLIIRDGGFIVVSTDGAGKGGNLTVNARDSVEMTNASDVNKITLLGGASSASGDAANVTISTGRLILRDNSYIGVGTSGAGQGGNLTIRADSVELIGNPEKLKPAGLVATTLATGNAGNITIASDILTIGNGGFINVSSLPIIELINQFKAGNIKIEDIQNSYIRVGNSGAGVEGNLTISAESLKLTENLAQMIPAGLVAATLASGYLGNIQLPTEILSIGNTGFINASSFPNLQAIAQGKAGNINIQAGDIRLIGDSGMTAISLGREGGNVSLSARSIQMRNNSNISAYAVVPIENTGTNINIVADTLAALESSKIIANNFAGPGANISLITQGVFLSPDSRIFASGSTNIQGVNTITPPDIPPVKVTNTEAQIKQSCSADRGSSTFTVIGRGGLPPSPTDVLNNDAIWVDLRDLGSKNSSSPTTEYALPTIQIVEAQGWVISPDGKTILTAEVPKVTPNSASLASPNCQ
ncbi:filamentous hemagglutinin N-terminal domain-containing protein [Aerosakkonema sp. BLCC-F183]|uniref:two-partner secretion domain-containing protein n=1 Tax=Aerosakkonema sp. BLCC-F183 TaxID=3342834 RepID=UPI0035BB9376